MRKFYFCSYIALLNGEIKGQGDVSFEVHDKVNDLKSLTDEMRQKIKSKWEFDDDVTLVFTAFNHVELPQFDNQ